EQRHQAFLPTTMDVQPLLWREAKELFLVDRVAGDIVAFDDAELLEKLAHRTRLLARDRHIVRSPRIPRDRVLTAARVAAALRLELEDLEVREARLGELPTRAKARDASAGDDDGDATLCRRRGKPPVAQKMAGAIRRADELAREWRCRAAANQWVKSPR